MARPSRIPVSYTHLYFEPEYTPSVSGGGSKELAEESIGYFTEAEVKEEK